MKKSNKKNSKKNDKKAKSAKKTDLFGGTGKSFKKLNLGRLSTSQKVAGGAALVALGLTLFAKRRGSNAAGGADATSAEQSLTALDGGNI